MEDKKKALETALDHMSARPKKQTVNRTDIKLNGNVCECRKIKMSLVDKMGKSQLSKMEMSAVIYLAEHQTADGYVETNCNIMCPAIDCNKSYFMDILHSLEKGGFISAVRSTGQYKCDNGVWKIRLIDNDLSEERSGEDNRYVTLAPAIFSSEYFFDLRPIEKYIVLNAFSNLHSDFTMPVRKWNNFVSREKYYPVAIDYKDLIARCEEWSGRTRSACLKALKKIRERWDIATPEEKHTDNGLNNGEILRILRIPKEDAVIRESDNYVYLTNLVMAALEEENVHLAEIYYSEPEEKRVKFFESFLRLAGKDQDKINIAGNNLRLADQIRYFAIKAGKYDEEAKRRICELEADADDICYRATHISLEFRYDKVHECYSPVTTRQTMSTIVLTSKEMPVLIKLCVMDLVSAYRFLRHWTVHIMHLSLSDIDVLRALEKTLEIVRYAGHYNPHSNQMEMIINRNRRETQII